jgi:hypothetical protein
MDDDYTRGEILGFIAAPLALMIPLWMYVFAVIVSVWGMFMFDMLGLQTIWFARRAR